MHASPYLTLGYILFLLGTLLGIPHGRSKGRDTPEHTDLWRIAHLSTCVGGIAVMVLSLGLPLIFPGHWMLLAAGFTSAAWLFFIACTLSGITGQAWSAKPRTPVIQLIYLLQIGASALSILVVAGSGLLLIQG